MNPLADSTPVGRMLCILGAIAMGVVFVLVTVIVFRRTCLPMSEAKVVCAAIAKSPPWTLLTSLAASPALALTWWWRTVHKDQDIGQKQTELDLAKREERSNRFVEAVKLLADPKAEARLGAIYSLESLATDAPEERKRVVETLCAFLRTSGKQPADDPYDQPHPDDEPFFQLEEVRVAFVIVSQLEYGGRLDLRRAKLACIEGPEAKLGKALLEEVNLWQANLYKANLSEASLYNSNLSAATLVAANLTGASLGGATLIGTSLAGANCSRANFGGANLARANLADANLAAADLSRARLFAAFDLEAPVLTGARYDAETRFPEGFVPESVGMILVDTAITQST